MSEPKKAHLILTMNTLAFTVCFAAWMLNGVLVTYLVDNRVFDWTGSEMGILIGIPVLTGSVMRLPVGILTDRYGGKPVYAVLLILSAIPMALLGQVSDFWGYALCSLGFGLSGAAFAVGIAFSSVWYSREHQGTALGIFGAGNAGSALTTLAAPSILRWLTDGGENIEAWRQLPLFYAGALVIMAVLFFLLTTNKKPEGSGEKTMGQLLSPLKRVRVWRFGLYYFLVFGGFVALAQWLVPYYVNVYSMSVLSAGLLTSIFSFPSGVIRALGGWMSDKFGARSVMYWILAITGICCLLLFFPKMDIESPGRGVMALAPGVVTEVTDTAIVVGEQRYPLASRPESDIRNVEGEHQLILPHIQSWQVAQVEVGNRVARKQLLARGVTHIFFQANVWVFTALVFIIGITMGIGKAAVYRHIPDYYPKEVGVVGGIVGVIGGLGGFFCPIIFGYLLDLLGLWTTTWVFLFVVTLVCLVWMHRVVRRMEREKQEGREMLEGPAVGAASTREGGAQPAGAPA
ncbi:MAG: NarK/NasA family nitrate transporter [Sandaracinaceae bacterium]|nr:NarK/NasA family nitrate transporter [Sandaracinaceae bacterium]